MKALTLTQPWATLVAIGAKKIETRSWPTTYRGPIAIHAAKGFPDYARVCCHDVPFGGVLSAAGYRDEEELPRGVIVAVATLAECWDFDEESAERIRGARDLWPEHEVDFGDFTPGRYGFRLDDVLRLATPVPARGMLNLWDLPADVALAVANQLTTAAA